jgi:hypothetical protein
VLVIVSDLRLSDGSLAPMVPAAAMEFFAGRLNELALAAGVRTDGHYRPIEAIDLVLLGDGLDLIRSATWLSTDARPWHDPHSASVFDAVSRVTAGVLDQNAATLEILRQLARGDIAGVSVRIHYMVGDHDWPLHLPGEQYGRLRAQIVGHMGLSNRADLPFPHDPAESQELLESLRRHRVLARHGDIYDPIHFETDRNSSSLGDALSIELFARFQLEMRRLDGELPETTLAGLAELNDVRPMLLAPAWIDDVLEHACDSAAARANVRLIWDGLVEQLLESPAIRSREAWHPVDLVDGLAESLLFGRRAHSVRRRSSGTGLADCFNGDGDPCETYRRHAFSEESFRNGNAKYVVYGHTHQTDFASLESNSANGRSPVQIYFNTGTWRPVISPTHCSPVDTLTYLAFYEQDERSGCPFETWTGSWAPPSMGKLIHRFDSRQAA